MKFITSWKVVVIGLLVGVLVLFIMSDETEVVLLVKKEVAEVRLSTSTLPVAVSGVLEAASYATIYAQTAGIINTIPYQEGAVVSQGAVLAKQDTPVINAQIALASAQGVLVDAERAAQVSSKAANNKGATVRAYSAAELAVLRANSNDNRLSETTAKTAIVVKASVATTLSAMDYINNNRSLLTADGLKLYNEAVRLTYGNRTTSFDSRFLTGSRVTRNETLQSLSDVASSSLVAAQTAASVTAQVLSLLDEALVSAEKDVFIRNDEDVDTPTYLTQKTAVATALSNIEVALSGATQVIDGTLEDMVGQTLAVDVTEIDRVEAELQATLAMEIAASARGVSDAALGVAMAEQSLGVVNAPFNGVVSHVLVEEGEYVTPGTPLLQLVGTGARELRVTVPASLVEALKIGQVFTVEGKEVGMVDRFSPVSKGSGHEVVIVLIDNIVSVGSTLRGYIHTETNDKIYKVPRAYLHFTSQGPSLAYGPNERVAVEIVYDAGDVLYIKTDQFKDVPLTPAIMITY